jgi:hypothetical protein
MSPEKSDRLTQSFPLLYQDKDKPLTESLMAFGFECGDGWFDIIWNLSQKLELLIEDFIKNNPSEEWVPRASQVKEKYGTLRFYMSSETQEMSDAISLAESESAKTCEECGKAGSFRGTSWVTVRCDEHACEK